MKNEPLDKELYAYAKQIADEKYVKNSAYKSSFLVKFYKSLGGRYSGTKTKEGLKRWHAENWQDIGNQSYPVYRPTKRVSKKTPLTATEVDPKQLKKQVALKQKIKGKKNLPKFEPKT